MSASEVIEQIKALPPQDKVAVAEFVHHQMEAAESKPADARRTELEVAAEKVFERYDPLFRKLAQ